jgi:hypothetical protein
MLCVREGEMNEIPLSDNDMWAGQPKRDARSLPSRKRPLPGSLFNLVELHLIRIAPVGVRERSINSTAQLAAPTGGGAWSIGKSRAGGESGFPHGGIKRFCGSGHRGDQTVTRQHCSGARTKKGSDWLVTWTPAASFVLPEDARRKGKMKV